jgi:hypothetical protein
MLLLFQKSFSDHGRPVPLTQVLIVAMKGCKRMKRVFVLLLCLYFLPAPALLGETLDSVQARIRAAEEALLLSEISERRTTSALEKIRASGEAPPETIRDYEQYLEHMRSMVQENRALVRELEAAYGEFNKGPRAVGEALEEDRPGKADPLPQDDLFYDEVCHLDRELDASLSAFDEMLLQELDLLAAKMDAIQATSSGKMTDLAEEAEEAAERLRKRGIDIDTSTADQTVEEEPPLQSGEAPDEERGPPAGGQIEESGTGDDRQRAQNRQDDDIVARQLREAAEKETDPELKEKLWKEYEAYKKGGSQEREP